MKSRLYLLTTLIASVVLISCIKQKPQLPSNKNNETDSVQLAMLELNSILINREDSILSDFVSVKYPEFNKDESGFWYFFKCKTEGKLLQYNETCTYNAKFFSLDNKPLFEETKTITIGKKQTISGIEEALKLMSNNYNAVIILPWYLAYGTIGNGDKIRPRTSVKVELKVLDR